MLRISKEQKGHPIIVKTGLNYRSGEGIGSIIL